MGCVIYLLHDGIVERKDFDFVWVSLQLTSNTRLLSLLKVGKPFCKTSSRTLNNIDWVKPYLMRPKTRKLQLIRYLPQPVLSKIVVRHLNFITCSICLKEVKTGNLNSLSVVSVGSGKGTSKIK